MMGIQAELFCLEEWFCRSATVGTLALTPCKSSMVHTSLLMHLALSPSGALPAHLAAREAAEITESFVGRLSLTLA